MKALQTDLFDSVPAIGNEPPEAGKRGVPAVAEEAGAVYDGLREYQEEAVTAGLARIQSGATRGIVKVFTGGGKTKTGIALARRWLLRTNGDHCLWLAPRIFLVEDAHARLSSSLGTYISREQAAFKGYYTRMTVGSAQTFVGKRLEQMDPDRYGLIIADESQALDSPGGQKILAHFKRSFVMGLSATPGPAAVFGGRTAVVYEKDILWGIGQGYFVPIAPRYEDVTGLDLSDVGSSDGDFKIGELDKAVATVAVGIAKLSYRICEDRPTLIYCPGVATVHAVTAWLNDARPGCAVATDAKTPPDVRRQTLEDFRAGKIQYIVNCGIYLYGLDVPTCRAIVIARPTEDRDLWEQMVGRGGRPAEGIGQLLHLPERHAAITASSKPNMLLLVLSGQAGKHSLCDLGDLDETADPQVRAKASEDIRKDPTKSLTDALRDARAWQRGENERVRLAMIQALVQSQGGTFDPFGVNEKRPMTGPLAPAWTREPATTPQQYWQRSKGLPWDITKGQAAQFRGKFENWTKTQGFPGHPVPSRGLKDQWISEILNAPMPERVPGEDG